MTKHGINARVVVSALIVGSVIVMASTNNVVDFVKNTFGVDLTQGGWALSIVVILVVLGLVDVKLFKKLGGN